MEREKKYNVITNRVTAEKRGFGRLGELAWNDVY